MNIKWTWCWHKYTKWEFFKETIALFSNVPVVYQQKTCMKCGKLRLRRESVI